MLVQNPQMRQKRKLVLWVISTPLALAALYLIASIPEDPNLWVFALIVTAFAIAATWGALWHTYGRMEWIVGTGRLVLQRRFRNRRSKRFEAVALELVEDNSGDSGPSYDLIGVAADAPARGSFQNSRKQRKLIHSESDDSTVPRKLGLWIRHHSIIPFRDFATPEARREEQEAVRIQLEASGWFGRLVLRLLDKTRRSS